MTIGLALQEGIKQGREEEKARKASNFIDYSIRQKEYENKIATLEKQLKDREIGERESEAIHRRDFNRMLVQRDTAEQKNIILEKQHEADVKEIERLKVPSSQPNVHLTKIMTENAKLRDADATNRLRMDAMREALGKQGICFDCLGEIAVANPTGKCNHVYYPEAKQALSEGKEKKEG